MTDPLPVMLSGDEIDFLSTICLGILANEEASIDMRRSAFKVQDSIVQAMVDDRPDGNADSGVSSDVIAAYKKGRNHYIEDHPELETEYE